MGHLRRFEVGLARGVHKARRVAIERRVDHVAVLLCKEMVRAGQLLLCVPTKRLEVRGKK